MAPNPIMLPRKKRSSHNRPSFGSAEQEQDAVGVTWPLLATSFAVLLIAISTWARRWLLSGAAVETLLVFFAAGTDTRIFPSIPLWTLLATFNLVYAIASTSWLLYALFAIACWPFVGITCLFQFEKAADLARKSLRSVLKDLHFTRDRIAFFNLPALEIDTEVSGLMVIRGATFSLSDLTLTGHGIEVGIKLTDEIELALHTDEVRVPLFRGIEIDDVYGNIKGGKAEMTFAEVEEEIDNDEDSFFAETALLRAATAGREGIKNRPTLRESLTGGSYIKSTSAKAGFDNIRTLSPDNQAVEQQYLDMLTEIRTTSAVYQSRARVRRMAKMKGISIDDEKDMRAAVCAELHDFPSVPHPPQHSVKVTTLQNLNKPAVRRFMHRLPFLLRVLLGPLGYFHPITIRSINAAGSGQWLKEILQQYFFKHYAEHSAEVRRIQRRMATWLADANFCLELTDIDGLGQVPLSTSFDVVAYLHFADIMAYRTMPQSGVMDQVVRLGGADATFTIPSFLLPHHEHLLPARPTAEDVDEMETQVEEADGIPKTMQAEQEMKKALKDETEINMSVHASLPAAFDPSLLTFIAALVKATKIIEFDKEVERLDTASTTSKDAEVDATLAAEIPLTPPIPDLSRVTTKDSTTTTTSTGTSDSNHVVPLHKRVLSDMSDHTTSNRFKSFTKNIQQNLRNASINTTDAMSKENIKDFMQDIHKSTKKAVVGSIVNDRWIAKLVGRIAANLEKAQGDVGYSGGIPIPLEPYRVGAGDDGTQSKLLP